MERLICNILSIPIYQTHQQKYAADQGTQHCGYQNIYEVYSIFNLTFRFGFHCTCMFLNICCISVHTMFILKKMDVGMYAVHGSEIA